MDIKDEEEERLTAFIESIKVDQTPFLMKLEKEALEDEIPIIRPGTRALIRFLLKAKSPERILEVGTAVGYSSLFMREYAPNGTKITTIEKDEKRAACARKNFIAYAKLAYAEDKKLDDIGITLLEGDAAELLKELEPPFDFIFMDAAKGQYIHFLPEVRRLLPPGGILLSDNILKEGEFLNSKFAVTRRNRTIHKRMREYLDALTNDEELETVVLGTGDGAAMSVRK